MADDVKGRRQVAVAVFIARRGELGLTQEAVAYRASLAARTVRNFESQGVWPNAKTRAGLERAVDWPAGELARLAAGPPRDVDPELIDRILKLSRAEWEWLVGWLTDEIRSRPREGGREAPHFAEA